MPNETIKQLKERGEIASEQGNQEEALRCFDHAFLIALESKDYGEAINLLGHHLHIYKVYFQKTGDDNFMELLFMDTEIGMRLAEKNNVSGQPVSVMLLRSGDYFLNKKEYAQAVNKYERAIKELERATDTPAETTAEYTGHYAAALVKAGKVDEGFTMFEKALSMITNNHSIREFHHHIIHSGILLREADSYVFLEEFDKAKPILEKATKLATELAEKFNMRMRLTQAEQLKNRIKI